MTCTLKCTGNPNITDTWPQPEPRVLPKSADIWLLNSLNEKLQFTCGKELRIYNELI